MLRFDNFWAICITLKFSMILCFYNFVVYRILILKSKILKQSLKFVIQTRVIKSRLLSSFGKFTMDMLSVKCNVCRIVNNR